jgi:hypothetical protein
LQAQIESLEPELAKIEQEMLPRLRVQNPDMAKRVEQTLKDLMGRRAELRSALKRLQSYILPRLTLDVDPSGLLLAEERGTTDWNTVRVMQVRTAEDVQKIESDPTWKRVQACRNPDWLPF